MAFPGRVPEFGAGPFWTPAYAAIAKCEAGTELRAEDIDADFARIGT